ncbi:PqqD family protein [Bradymonas sediminis]|nr:PqqD family protein [Bradymonas sediminis]TDP62994.1 coenzyme PQQ synthesis protein D (PqqD) [Bradymonas sediminis]
MTENLFPRDAVFSIREDLVVEQVDDEFLVLDLRGNEYFGLNAVARHIWAAIDAGDSLAAIADSVCERFEVERERAATDVADFIANLLEQRLVSRVDA